MRCQKYIVLVKLDFADSFPIIIESYLSLAFNDDKNLIFVGVGVLPRLLLINRVVYPVNPFDNKFFIFGNEFIQFGGVHGEVGRGDFIYHIYQIPVCVLIFFRHFFLPAP